MMCNLVCERGCFSLRATTCNAKIILIITPESMNTHSPKKCNNTLGRSLLLSQHLWSHPFIQKKDIILESPIIFWIKNTMTHTNWKPMEHQWKTNGFNMGQRPWIVLNPMNPEKNNAVKAFLMLMNLIPNNRTSYSVLFQTIDNQSHASYSTSDEFHVLFCCRFFGVNTCSWIETSWGGVFLWGNKPI